MIGKSKTTMSNIENGKEPANVYILEEIADALGIEITQLFTSPQQQININNSPNSNGGNNGTHTINYIMPQELVDKHFNLMEKISEKL